MSTSGGAIKAGQAFVEISVRDKMTDGLKRAAGRLQAFAGGVKAIGVGMAQIGGTITAIGGAIVGPLIGAAKHFADTGSAIADMSARTGVAADHLSELVYAAEQGGASAGDLETALKTMAKNGLDPNKFDEAAASVAGITDPVERVGAALKLWGRAGTKMLPIVDALQSLRGEARSLGLTIDPKTAAKADELGDAIDRLLKVGKDIAFELGSAIAGPLTQFANIATQVGAAIGRWIQENQALVVTVGAIGVIALTAGAAITSVGLAIVGVASAIGGIAIGLTALASTTGIIVAAVLAVAVGLALAVAGFVIFTKAGQYAAESTMAMLGGIANAIAGGNILNAWGQLSTGMVIIWFEMVKKIKQAFVQVMQEVTGILGTVINGMADQIEKLPFGKKLADTMRGAVTVGVVVRDVLGAQSIGQTDSTISGLQIQLDTLRGMVAKNGGGFAFPQLPKLASILDGIGEKAATGILGGANGTFNAAAASLLGRSGSPMERTAKAAEKQTGILEKMKELLGDIDDGIEGLEGFSFQ